MVYNIFYINEPLKTRVLRLVKSYIKIYKNLQSLKIYQTQYKNTLCRLQGRFSHFKNNRLSPTVSTQLKMTYRTIIQFIKVQNIIVFTYSFDAFKDYIKYFYKVYKLFNGYLNCISFLCVFIQHFKESKHFCFNCFIYIKHVVHRVF